MDAGFSFWPWFVAQWSRVGIVCAVVVLALLPVLANDANMPLILLVTLLPVYMVHQYEEHAHGRFLAFFNATIGRGHQVLTPLDAFWVNIGLVWILFLCTFYLARFVGLDFALIPVYLTVVNAVTHLMATLKLRRYNPGLWTSLVLFFPWGGYLLVSFNRLTGAGVGENLAALLFAALTHAGIAGFALRRRSLLEAEGRPSAKRLASSR